MKNFAFGTALAGATLVFTLSPAGTAHAGNLTQAFVPIDKLVGTGAVGNARQGSSVALSADGSTAIVGGTDDDSMIGAVWIYVRSGGSWVQQDKLIGTGYFGPPVLQGSSVALSADGNTALVGGRSNNAAAGAAWVFTRTNGVWSQQGNKLVGMSASGNAGQGTSVALSADGNTALVGGPHDNSDFGAAWVFTRSGGSWTQLGDKLVGSGAILTGPSPQQGASVALSADGNTALVGGPKDDSNVGATWVFVRSGGGWVQQDKLVGTGGSAPSAQGSSVALSSDGNTALVGAAQDNPFAGAAWVFTRSLGVWGQQGNRLVGTGAVGDASQGISVALSGDGNTALVGGPHDEPDLGAIWVFTRSLGDWSQQGIKLVGPTPIGLATGIYQGTSVALSTDGKVAVVGGNGDDGGKGAAWVFKTPCLRGDANASGVLDIVDVFYLINFLFAGGAAPSPCY